MKQLTLSLVIALAFSVSCHGFTMSNPKKNINSTKNLSSKKTKKKNKINNASSPSSQSSTTSSDNRRTPRGTNSNKSNTRRNERQTAGYNFRSSGIKMKRKRPPRWEVEGDSLFLAEQHTSQNGGNNNSSNQVDDEYTTSIQEFDELYQSKLKDIGSSNNHDNLKLLDDCLKIIFDKEEKAYGQQNTSSNESKKKPTEDDEHNNDDDDEEEESNMKSKMMWGSLSVGPILQSKLTSIYSTNSKPTPIQEEAFKILTKNNNNNQNFVIASPTGSGKTLAFCLPIISTSSIKDERKILIVTPTLELAFQIQKVVNQLWDDKAVYVMDTTTTSNNEDVNQIMEWNIEAMMLSKAPIIASTPKILLQMISTISNNGSNSNNKRNRYQSIFSNLQTIVLDECDRLLQTELVARHDNDMKVTTTLSNDNTRKRKRNSLSSSSKPFVNDNCPTIQLINALERKMGVPISIDTHYQPSNNANQKRRKNIQLICASATVGRTLRRQIMELTNASSVEKSSMLITADDRTGKDVVKRRNSILPTSIEHKYVVSSKAVIPSNIQIDDEEYLQQMKFIQSLLESMKSLDAGSSIVFPGKIGVQKMVRILGDLHGFDGVQTLRDGIDNDAEEEEEEEGINKEEINWKDVPIHIVGEKFGRGLDIPNVQYVFISSPPVSPAAYAHLAGRTGRANQNGTAITFVRDMKEAKRLIYLSKKLGIHFGRVNDDDVEEEEEEGNESEAVVVSESISEEESINNKEREEEDNRKSSLHDFTINQLKDILRERNLKVSGRKDELIARLMETNDNT